MSAILGKVCTRLGFIHQIFPKMADRQRGTGLSPLAVLEREISKMLPFRPP